MQNDYVDEVLGKGKSPLSKSLMDKATAALGGASEDGPKHGFRSTHVDHHKDGSHTVRHTPKMGDEISYAVKDNNELTQKIKKYLGKSGDDEVNESDSPAKEKSEGEKETA
jgi:hypothetical protein